MKKFKVTLSMEEREELHDIVKNIDVAKVLQIGNRTIDRLKKLFVEEGFEIALHGKTEVSPKGYTSQAE